jgi:signal transduction histidine kinase
VVEFDKINDAIDAVQVQAQQKNITIKTSIPVATPMIIADKEKTTWVLINFLTNAIKYSFESSSVEISASVKTDRLEVTVRDHGRGIDEKYLPKVFDRYFKVPGSHERSRTGLGLATVYGIVQHHHGEIQVHSVPGQGTRFTIYLPLSERSSAVYQHPEAV